MDQFHFVFAIFFMLLGPIKVLPAFAALTRDHDLDFRRKAAFQATAFAAVICVFLILTSSNTLARYHIHRESLKLAAGVVLLISALRVIFPNPQKEERGTTADSPLAISLSPLATPLIVTPAGIAAIMIFVSIAHEEAGMYRAIIIALIAVLILDYLIMRFSGVIVRQPWVLPMIRLLGSVMLVIQVAGAMDLIVVALKDLGLFHR
jgi:multiple antibiotic resistance protein